MTIEALKPEDLFGTCPRCGGTGQMPQAPPPPSQGFGRHVLYSSPERCGGRCINGRAPTLAGNAILDLIQQFGHVANLR